MLDTHGFDTISTTDLVKRLENQPQLKARILAMLDVVENTDGNVVRADEAEQRFIEELRLMGLTAMQAWAQRKQNRVESQSDKRSDLTRKQKRIYWHTRFGEVEVAEQVYRRKADGAQLRPFSASAGVVARGYSQGLQRAMTDFGADQSFCAAVVKVKEHYGIAVPESAVRVVTQQHAQAMLERDLETALPAAGIARLIAEMDGCMVPIVSFQAAEPPDSTADKRKLRRLEWKQARLSLVRKPGELNKLYNATMREAEQAGVHLLDLANEAGAGQNTLLHCVGDGASWIVEQVEQRFGERGIFLVDFYHVSEYLAGASAQIAGTDKKQWLDQQQELMKQSRVSEVVVELRGRLASETDQQRREPIEACERYLVNRLEHLDYQAAIRAGLPIGSGEVESGHRSVIQARLKLSGAWWKIENAEKMLALRAVRANGKWQSYWDKLRQAAA